VLLEPPPKTGAIQIGRVGGRGRGGSARHLLGQFDFLLGSEKEIAVGLDGQILAFFLLESAIGTALTVEGVKVVDVELRVGEPPREVGALGLEEGLPMREIKLGGEKSPC
jgi:hypothetical protein